MANLFTESTSQIIKKGMVKTSSSFQRVWLGVFRGYTVEKKIQTPKGYSLGRLTYQTSWVMKRKKADN